MKGLPISRASQIQLKWHACGSGFPISQGGCVQGDSQDRLTSLPDQSRWNGLTTQSGYMLSSWVLARRDSHQIVTWPPASSGFHFIKLAKCMGSLVLSSSLTISMDCWSGVLTLSEDMFTSRFLARRASNQSMTWPPASSGFHLYHSIIHLGPPAHMGFPDMHNGASSLDWLPISTYMYILIKGLLLRRASLFHTIWPPALSGFH